jgi:hypothetical protein
VFIINIKEQILVNLLKGIKINVSKGNYTPADRKKNHKFLTDNGLTLDDVKETILSLTTKDIHSGPEDDRNGFPGYVLKFKSDYLTDELIYIKIRYNPPDEVVCISFHQDEI